MLSNLKIGTRLMFGFGIVLLLMLTIAVLAILRIGDFNEKVDLLVNDRYPKTVWANNVIDNVNVTAIALRNAALAGSPEEAQRELDRIPEVRKTIVENLEKLTATITSEKGKALLKKVVDARAVTVGHEDRYIALFKEGRYDEAMLTGDVDKSQADYIQAVAELIEYQGSLVEKAGKEAESLARSTQTLLIAITAVAFVLVLLIALLLARGITRPLNEAIQAAEAIAAGDLASRLEQRDAQDEASRLLTAMATMQSRLRAMVTDTQKSAERLARSAQELSTVATQTASAAEAQTESASGMAASVEEMSVSIDRLRDHAQEAHGLASQSGEQSRSGGGVVHSAAGEIGKIADAVNTSAQVIRELEGTSNEISAIVSVIREIADQTNLLALNAAIEAARAGEQGRGFAVVADEVRKLAERTANSTQQIAGMIDKVQAGARRAAQEMETGVTRVTEGVSLAHQAGDSITGIQESANRVVGVVEDISSALREQSIASQEIAKEVERIAQMSEKSSAAARQTADATQELQQLAEALRASVAHFRV